MGILSFNIPLVLPPIPHSAKTAPLPFLTYKEEGNRSHGIAVASFDHKGPFQQRQTIHSKNKSYYSRIHGFTMTHKLRCFCQGFGQLQAREEADAKQVVHVPAVGDLTLLPIEGV